MKLHIWPSIATIFLLSVIFHMSIVAQVNDPVLFTVDGKPVRTSEFEYIYTKNNAKDADYSKASLREYLDLYIKFKMKVQAAYDASYDTIPGLKAELKGYRDQLASSYLLDKEVKNRLVEEVYERQQTDINISHILIGLDNRSTGADSAAAYEKALEARKLIVDEGRPFTLVAQKYSDDKTVETNGGNLGYVSAMLPDGYYNVENAIYNMEDDAVSQPILSKRGYHVIKVNDVRPARGEMEIAHILARKKGEEGKVAEAKIRRLYAELENGESFEDIARNYSDDKATGQRGGYIGYIKIGLYEQAFEDAAYALEADGAYSDPIESSVGWHIIKRISKKEQLPLQLAKRSIETDLRNSERIEVARSALIEQIKKDANYKFYEEEFEKILQSVDTNLFEFSWRPPSGIDEEPLFKLGDNQTYTNKDFLEFVRKEKRGRIQMQGRKSVADALRELYQDYLDDQCIAYEESLLEKKYPDFKALMREYEEGILLFEITRDKVWDKASSDSTGLQAFFESHRDNYKWPERMLVSEVHIDSVGPQEVEEIYELAKRKGMDKVLSKYNKDRPIISIEQQKWKKEKAELSNLAWDASSTGPLVYDESTKDGRFIQFERLIPAELKSLEEARGYIIADYQDYLEDEWIKELKGRYEVEIDEDVFNSLIRQ